MTSYIEQAKEELDKIVEEKEAQGGFKRGELIKTFEKLSKKYGVSFYTLKNYYYRHKEKANEDTENKEEIKEEVNNQKDEPSNQENQELEHALRTPSLRPLVAPYKYGDLIDVEITKIVSYGAFVKTLDGYEYKGLIHVSEIKNEYVDDVSLYFDVGDRIKAKVKKVYKDKIEFSTKGLKVPLKIRVEDTNLGEKLNKVKQTLQAKEEDKEFEEIVRFINGIVGALSPEAKQRMREVINKHGLFKFTLGVTKVSENFKPDLGLLFIEEVDKKVAGGL